MKKTIILLISAGLALAGCTAAPSSNNSTVETNSIQIAASFYVIEELTKQVGGDHVTIVSPPGSSGGHSYSPSPQDLARLLESDMFIFQGASFDPWAEKLVEDFESQDKSVVEITKYLELQAATADEHDGEDEEEHTDEHGLYDPHTWTSPLQVIDTVEVIRDALIALDPEYADIYTQNATEYIAELESLHTLYEAGLANCSQDKIIVAHDAFGYMSRQYGFNIEPIAGFSPDAVPSAKHIAELSEHIKEDGIEYILFETLATPDVAQTLANDVGAKTLVLNPLEGLTEEEIAAGKDYIAIMKENLITLQTALDCQP